MKGYERGIQSWESLGSHFEATQKSSTSLKHVCSHPPFQIPPWWMVKCSNRNEEPVSGAVRFRRAFQVEAIHASGDLRPSLGDIEF